jgi:hypothetical protein
MVQWVHIAKGEFEFDCLTGESLDSSDHEYSLIQFTKKLITAYGEAHPVVELAAAFHLDRASCSTVLHGIGTTSLSDFST